MAALNPQLLRMEKDKRISQQDCSLPTPVGWLNTPGLLRRGAGGDRCPRK